MLRHDIIVVGGGLAGLRAALAVRGADVDIDALLDAAVSTGTDAHTGRLGLMEFGVDVARRGWLEKEELMNTRAAKDVRFKERTCPGFSSEYGRIIYKLRCSIWCKN